MPRAFNNHPGQLVILIKSSQEFMSSKWTPDATFGQSLPVGQSRPGALRRFSAAADESSEGDGQRREWPQKQGATKPRMLLISGATYC